MKTLSYFFVMAVILIAGCVADDKMFENKASLDWQLKQSDKYLKKEKEIDSNILVSFSNYSLLYNIINEIEASCKQMNRTLKFAMNSMKLRKTSSYNYYGENKEKETLKEIWATEAFNKGSIALFEKRNPKKALRFYNRGVKFLPDEKSLLLMRGLCNYELGKIESAIEDWNKMTSYRESINMDEYSNFIENMKGYDELMAIIDK